MDLITINEAGSPVLNFYAMFKRLSQETGRNPYSWEPEHDGHYDVWKQKRGYVKGDQESNRSWLKAYEERNKTWFQEYIAAPDGEAACPKYLNFWHIWLQWVCKESFENSDPPPKVNFTQFLSRMADANGIETDKHKYYLGEIRRVAATLEEVRGASLIRSYEASFKLDYELDWAMDIVKMIMGWIGPEYENAVLLVNYDED